MPDAPRFHLVDLTALYLSAELCPTFRDQLAALVEATNSRFAQTRHAAWAELVRMADRADAHRNAEA